MITVPLLALDAPDQPLFLHADRVVTRAAFAEAARRFAGALDGAGPVLNLCAARDAFALTLAAALLRDRPALLPPSATPAVLRQLVAEAGCTTVIGDNDDAAAAGLAAACPPAIATSAGAPLGRDSFPATRERHRAQGALRQGALSNSGSLTIPAARLAVRAYTSGSTGTPQPHSKTWGMLAATARLLAENLLEGLPGARIVATVPPQHMFGLETTILLPLFSDAAIDAGRPFFPADIAAALARLDAPRVLVTTPVHLRALLVARPVLPPLARLICATAPLPTALAAEAEQVFGAPLYELYGSTETGAVASRRTVADARWQPFRGVRIAVADGVARLAAAHLPEAVTLSDRIEVDADDRFRLLGRSADLIKVAGKRISAAELTQQLLAIAGVEDAAVLAPDETDPAGRPAALVVAPALSEAQILDALAQRVDPVFLPRPLRCVGALPRNALGKLPRAALLELLGR